VSNVVSAVDQLRQTIETPRLEGNVGLNVICILVNTDMTGDILWTQQRSMEYALKEEEINTARVTTVRYLLLKLCKAVI